MSWYDSRTDGELVALAADGDRSARVCLVDRTLLPSSRVAVHLHDDRDRAIQALVSAYRETFRNVPELEDGERFLPVLLSRLDATTPFPLDPATHAALDPVDRDRVRARVLGGTRGRVAVPLAAVLAAVVAVALFVVIRPAGDPVTVTSTPDGRAAVESTSTETATDPLADPTSTPAPSPEDGDAPTTTPTGGEASEPESDGTFDGGTGTGELAETR